jgi:twitching motility protein PilT
MDSVSDQLKPIAFDERHQILDLYIPLEQEDGHFSMTEAHFDRAYCFTGDLTARRVFDGHAPQLMQWLLDLYVKAEAAQEKADNYRLELDGTYFRAQRMMTQEGPVLALRRVPEKVPSLNDLKMPATWRTLLLDASLLNGGLVLATAPNGQGKTTLISATVRSRLERFGGFCNTVEDPPELPLMGFFGSGPCNQIPVERDADGVPGTGFGTAMVRARRFFPALTGGGTILMVGEIRTPEAAAETLLAAFEGHLVLASFHGASAAHSIMRFASMASEKIGKETAKDLLAATLKLCFNQKLVMGKEGTGWERGELRGNVFMVPKDDDAAVGDLRDGSLDKLISRTTRQNEALRQLPDTATAVQIRDRLAAKN